jgi:hypothetical protein
VDTGESSNLVATLLHGLIATEETGIIMHGMVAGRGRIVSRSRHGMVAAAEAGMFASSLRGMVAGRRTGMVARLLHGVFTTREAGMFAVSHGYRGGNGSCGIGDGRRYRTQFSTPAGDAFGRCG